MVKGQLSLIDLEEFYTRWQRLMPLFNQTCPHVIREQVRSMLPWNKEKVVEKDTKNSEDSWVVDSSGLDPSLGCAPFQKELGKYCAQSCIVVPEIVCYAWPGPIVDCKDPYLLERPLQLNSTPDTNGHIMKVEKHRPRLKPGDIYALAHKDLRTEKLSNVSVEETRQR